MIMDRLTKDVIFEHYEEMMAKSVAEIFIHCFYRHHGVPNLIISDKDSQFIGIM